MNLPNRPNGKLPFSVYAGYGVGQVGGQIMRDTPALLLPFFMTNVLGLAAGLASLAILIPKMWVFFADPIVGVVSDKTDTRWGRRRPFILVGGMIAAVSFYFMFSVPSITDQFLLFIYMTVLFALMSTGFSLFSVPYLTMASEMSDDPHERTTILSYRNGFLCVGLLIGGSLAPRLTGMGGGGREGYEIMGLVLAATIAVSTLWLFFGTANARQFKSNDQTIPLRDQISVALSNRPFVVLISANIIQYISAGIGYAGIVYYITNVVGAPAHEVLPIIILIMAFTGIFCLPIFVKISGRFGKMPVYTWSLVLFAITTQTWFLATPDRLWPFWAVSFFIGVFNTGFILMSFSVLTDTIEYDRAKTGLNREGALSAVYSATEKISFAVGSALFTFIIGLAGYVSSTGGDVVQQPDSAIWGIRIGFVIVPAVMMLASILVLRSYNMTAQKEADSLAAEAAPAE